MHPAVPTNFWRAVYLIRKRSAFCCFPLIERSQKPLFPHSQTDAPPQAAKSGCTLPVQPLFSFFIPMAAADG